MNKSIKKICEDTCFSISQDKEANGERDISPGNGDLDLKRGTGGNFKLAR